MKWVLAASFVAIFGGFGVTYMRTGIAADTTICQAADTSLARAQNTAIVVLSGDDFKAENADRTTTPKPYALRYSQNYARFQTCAGDDYYTTDHRQRSELKENPLPARAYGDVFWASFRVKATGEPLPIPGYTIVHQIHQNRPSDVDSSTDRPPTLSFSYGQNGGLGVNLRCGDDSGNVTTQQVLPQPIPGANGREFNVTYRAKIGQTNGEFALWIDGKEQFNKTNLCFGYPYGGKETIPKVKFGIYRANASTQLVVEYRDIHISPNGQAPTDQSTSAGGGSGSASRGDDSSGSGTPSGSGSPSVSKPTLGGSNDTHTATVPDEQPLQKPAQDLPVKMIDEQPTRVVAILEVLCLAGILACLAGVWFVRHYKR